MIIGDDKYTTSIGSIGQGSAVQIGPNAQLTTHQAWQQISAVVDLPQLAIELKNLESKLREQMGTEPTPEQYADLSNVAAARNAAAASNGGEVLRHLKLTGKWVLDVAEKLSVGVAIHAIKHAMGL